MSWDSPVNRSARSFPAPHRLAEHDPRHRQRLGDQRGHIGEAALLLGRDLAPDLADASRQVHEQRHEHERERRQLPVQDAHGDDGRDHRRRVLSDRRRRRRDDVVESTDVVRDPRLDLAGAGAREERKRHLLQAPVDGGAEVVHHVLPDDVRQVRLPDVEGGRDDRDHDHRQHQHGQQRGLVLEDSLIEDASQQERLQHAEAGREDDHAQYDRQAGTIGPEQLQDPAAVALARRVHQRGRLLVRTPHRAHATGPSAIRCSKSASAKCTHPYL